MNPQSCVYNNDQIIIEIQFTNILTRRCKPVETPKKPSCDILHQWQYMCVWPDDGLVETSIRETQEHHKQKRSSEKN